ncbi:MAG TPA: D-alanine--D-alanine ligase, partial [Pseudothermotoga sp.]
YVLELNTIPGLTDLSDLPASAKAAGMSFEQLIDAIIRTVVE